MLFFFTNTYYYLFIVPGSVSVEEGSHASLHPHHHIQVLPPLPPHHPTYQQQTPTENSTTFWTENSTAFWTENSTAFWTENSTAFWSETSTVLQIGNSTDFWKENIIFAMQHSLIRKYYNISKWNYLLYAKWKRSGAILSKIQLFGYSEGKIQECSKNSS